MLQVAWRMLLISSIDLLSSRPLGSLLWKMIHAGAGGHYHTQSNFNFCVFFVFWGVGTSLLNSRSVHVGHGQNQLSAVGLLCSSTPATQSSVGSGKVTAPSQGHISSQQPPWQRPASGGSSCCWLPFFGSSAGTLMVQLQLGIIQTPGQSLWDQKIWKSFLSLWIPPAPGFHFVLSSSAL